jgi:2-keto-4-pentenoate hydratase
MNEELSRAQRRQLERLARLEAAGEVVGGWKLGLTSGAARDAFGADVRPFGFILASRILADGDRLDWSRVGDGGIENEVCFLVGSDVTETVTAASIRPHIAAVSPAFEINQRRIPADAPPAERIEDGMANWGIVAGPPLAIPRDWEPESLTVTLGHEGRTVASVDARGHIDDHFESLARLANLLLEFGRHLKVGERLITGAFGRQTRPEPGLWTGDFGPDLGIVAVQIQA